MELRHSTAQRDGIMTAERYSRGNVMVNVTEIIFDEEERRLRYPELFVSGLGVLNDYVRVYDDGRIALDKTLSERDVLYEIERGRGRERFRRHTIVISPLLNNVLEPIILPATY